MLFATPAGGILFGAVGGVFAAPFVKIALDAYEKCRALGLFGSVPMTRPESTEPTSPDESPPGPGGIEVPSRA